jgi:hypothetical protein
MPTISEEAIWNIGETARHATQEKSERIESVVRMAAELAVDVVAKLCVGEMSADDVRVLTRHATEMAAQKLSDLVADVAEQLADNHLSIT